MRVAQRRTEALVNRARAQRGGWLRDFAEWRQLFGGDQMVERDGDGAGAQNREIAEHPVGRVLADQEHAIARLDAARGEQHRGAMGAVAQLAIRRLRLLAGWPARDHRDWRAVAVGGAI